MIKFNESKKELERKAHITTLAELADGVKASELPAASQQQLASEQLKDIVAMGDNLLTTQSSHYKFRNYNDDPSQMLMDNLQAGKGIVIRKEGTHVTIDGSEVDAVALAKVLESTDQTIKFTQKGDKLDASFDCEHFKEHIFSSNKTVDVSVAGAHPDCKIDLKAKPKVYGMVSRTPDTTTGKFPFKEFEVDRLRLGGTMIIRDFEEEKEGVVVKDQLIDSSLSFFGVHDRRDDLIATAKLLRHAIAPNGSMAFLRKSKTFSLTDTETLYYQVWIWKKDVGETPPTEAEVEDINNWNRDTILQARGEPIVKVGPNGDEEDTKAWRPETPQTYPANKYKGQMIYYSNIAGQDSNHYISILGEDRLWTWTKVDFTSGGIDTLTSTDDSIEISPITEGETNLSIKKLKSDLFTSDDGSVSFSDKDGKVNVKATGGGGGTTPITAGIGTTVTNWEEITKIQVASTKGTISDKTLMVPEPAYEIGDESEEGHKEGHYHTIKQGDGVTFSEGTGDQKGVLTIQGDYMDLLSDDDSIEIADKAENALSAAGPTVVAKKKKQKTLKVKKLKKELFKDSDTVTVTEEGGKIKLTASGGKGTLTEIKSTDDTLKVSTTEGVADVTINKLKTEHFTQGSGISITQDNNKVKLEVTATAENTLQVKTGSSSDYKAIKKINVQSTTANVNNDELVIVPPMLKAATKEDADKSYDYVKAGSGAKLSVGNDRVLTIETDKEMMGIYIKGEVDEVSGLLATGAKKGDVYLVRYTTSKGGEKVETKHVNLLTTEPATVEGNWLDLGPVQGPAGKPGQGVQLKGVIYDPLTELVTQSTAVKGDTYIASSWTVGDNPHNWYVNNDDKDEEGKVHNYMFMLVESGYSDINNWKSIGPLRGRPGSGTKIGEIEGLSKEGTVKHVYNVRDVKFSKGFALEDNTTYPDMAYLTFNLKDVISSDDDKTIDVINVETTEGVGTTNTIKLGVKKLKAKHFDTTEGTVSVKEQDEKIKLGIEKLSPNLFKDSSTVTVASDGGKIKFNSTANISAKIGDTSGFINLIDVPSDMASFEGTGNNTLKFKEGSGGITAKTGATSTYQSISKINVQSINSSISDNTLSISPQVYKPESGTDKAYAKIKAGSGISMSVDDTTQVLTVTANGGGGGSSLTVEGRDITDTKDISGVPTKLNFEHMFSIDKDTEDETKYNVRLRHEGALLGFFHSFESGLAIAAKQHKADWDKGKVVGGVFAGAEGEATNLIAIDIYTWKLENKPRPTDEEIKDKSNWEKITVSRRGLSTAISAAPPTTATHPHKTWKGQIVYCENTQGGAASQKGFYFSDGTNWKKMDIDGTGGSAINISGQYNSADVLKDGQETWPASEVDFSTRDFELTKSASYATDKKVTVKSRGWAISDKSGPKSPNSHGFKIVGQDGVEVTVEDESGSAKIIVKGTGGSSDLTVSGKDEISGQSKDIPNVTKIAFDVDQFYVKESTEGADKNATIEFAGLPIKGSGLPTEGKKADELKFAGDVTLSESDGTVTVTVASGSDITFEGKAKDLTDVTMVPKKVKFDQNNFTLVKDETNKELSVNYRGLPIQKKDTTGQTVYAASVEIDGNATITKKGDTAAVLTLGTITAAGKILGGDELPSSTDMRKITFSANNAYVKTTGIVSGGQDIEVTPAIAVKGEGSSGEYKPLSQVDMTNSDKESYSLTPSTKTAEGSIALKVKQPVISAGTLDDLSKRYPATSNTHRFAFVDSSGGEIEGSGDTLYYSTPEGSNEQGVGNTIYYSHSGTEGAKWKTLAYPEMDQDVRDLMYRYPQRITERKSGYTEKDHRNIDYIYVKKEDVIKSEADGGLGFDKDDYSRYIYSAGMGDGLLHNIFGIKQEGASEIEYWVQILYNMGSTDGTYIRQKVDKKGSTTQPKEREWSPWGRMGIAALTAANHSVLISDNDYSYKALRDNGNALPLRLYQDPTSNIAFDTAVGKAGGFKVNRSGYYDIYVRTQYTWETRGKYKKDSKGQIQLWQDYPDWFSTAGKGHKLASLVTTGNIAFNDKEDIYPFKGKFEKKFLQAGKTYFVCSGFQNNDEGTEENLQLDPFKNMISIDPSPTETGGFKTAEAIVDTLYHSLSGLSFDVGYEVRAEQEGTSGKGKILGEAYNTTLTDTIPDTVVGA